VRKRLISVLCAVILFVGIMPSSAGAATGYESVYQWNLSVYDSKSTDEATLAYYRLPEYMVNSLDEDTANLALSITTGKVSDYEKIKAIHDWVAENIWYDAECGIIGSTYVLQNKRTICHGYANLTALYLGQSGFLPK